MLTFFLLSQISDCFVVGVLYASVWLHCASRNNWVTTNCSPPIARRKRKKVESNEKAEKLAAWQVLLLSEWQQALPHCAPKIYRSSYRQKKINSLHMHCLLAEVNWKLPIRAAGGRVLTQSSTSPKYSSPAAAKREHCTWRKIMHQARKMNTESGITSPLVKDAQRGAPKHRMLYLAGCAAL